jgi:hypothetical protein
MKSRKKIGVDQKGGGRKWSAKTSLLAQTYTPPEGGNSLEHRPKNRFYLRHAAAAVLGVELEGQTWKDLRETIGKAKQPVQDAHRKLYEQLKGCTGVEVVATVEKYSSKPQAQAETKPASKPKPESKAKVKPKLHRQKRAGKGSIPADDQTLAETLAKQKSQLQKTA